MSIKNRMKSLNAKVVIEATRYMSLLSPTTLGNQSAVIEDLSRKNVLTSFRLESSPGLFCNIFLANSVLDTRLAAKMIGSVKRVQGPISPTFSTHMKRELKRTTNFLGKILKATRDSAGFGSVSSSVLSRKNALLAPQHREKRDDVNPMENDRETLPVEK